MLIKCFVVGPIETNCYLVVDEETQEAIIIDPDLQKKEEVDKVLKEITGQNLRLKYIINTHSHADHIGGNKILKQATDAEILVHKKDASLLTEPWNIFSESGFGLPPCPLCGNVKAELKFNEDRSKATIHCPKCGFALESVASPPADRSLVDGFIIEFGNLEFKVIHTPGHSMGGISLYCESEKVVFTGDTLFAGSIGRTDLPLASFDDIMKSLARLAKLPDETVVYPGHGMQTTIAKERRTNPYLREAL